MFLQNALKEFVSSADTSYAKKFEEFFVGFDGRWAAQFCMKPEMNDGTASMTRNYERPNTYFIYFSGFIS